MTKNSTPPIGQIGQHRQSNLELFRIICMLMIVAHHYVVNSGLIGEGGFLMSDYSSGNSIFLSLFGVWGKTGINCFMMITGYFMCTNKISLRKFVKLMCQIYFYKLIIFLVFLCFGREIISIKNLIKLIMPFWGFNNNFTSCFIVFWLTIPFLNILIQNMNKKQHKMLIILMMSIYTIFGSIPYFNVTFNYVVWFGIIYIISSYIRLYPDPIFKKNNIWMWLSFLFVILAMGSILVLRIIFRERAGMGDLFLSDCNKFFAVVISICSFVWFKNMNIKYSKIINAFGAGTFGVLLIHANSDAMRAWLWQDIIDVVGHYSLPLIELATYSLVVVLTIFTICNILDQIRICTIEKWFFHWYDNKFSTKLDVWIQKVIQ